MYLPYLFNRVFDNFATSFSDKKAECCRRRKGFVFNYREQNKCSIKVLKKEKGYGMVIKNGCLGNVWKSI